MFYSAKHAAPQSAADKLDTPELRAQRMAFIMDLPIEQLRDMLLTLAIEEPATFDAARFSAL